MTINFNKTTDFHIMERKTSDDRIIELEQIPGEHTKDASGAVDNRLFKGENRLHATKDPQVNMWKFHFEKGAIPGGLSGMFTSFNKALYHAESYFKRRGIRIKNVIE